MNQSMTCMLRHEIRMDIRGVPDGDIDYVHNLLVLALDELAGLQDTFEPPLVIREQVAGGRYCSLQLNHITDAKPSVSQWREAVRGARSHAQTVGDVARDLPAWKAVAEGDDSPGFRR